MDSKLAKNSLKRYVDINCACIHCINRCQKAAELVHDQTSNCCWPTSSALAGALLSKLHKVAAALRWHWPAINSSLCIANVGSSIGHKISSKLESQHCRLAKSSGHLSAISMQPKAPQPTGQSLCQSESTFLQVCSLSPSFLCNPIHHRPGVDQEAIPPPPLHRGRHKRGRPAEARHTQCPRMLETSSDSLGKTFAVFNG